MGIIKIKNKDMIKSIEFNWFFTEGNGEEWSKYTVGQTYTIDEVEKKCIEIRQHSSQGEGDRWYYDVLFSDGSIRRVFNPNIVDFKNE